MNLDYVLAPAGILCLCVPATVFTSSRDKEKMGQWARRHEFGVRSLLRVPINWIDLARAASGAWLVQHVFSAAGSGQEELALTYLSAQIVIVCLAAIIQTVWLNRPIRVIGPLFFLSGLALVLCGPLVGVLALGLGLGCSLLVRRLSLAFVLVPASLLIFAALLGHLGLMTIITAGAFTLPAFLSFAFGSRIAFARRLAEAPKLVDAIPQIEIAAEPEAGNGIVITPDFSISRVKVARRSLA